MALIYFEGDYPNTGSSQPRAYAYGAGLHVLVGDAGLILTSPDLVTWTTQSSPNTNDWKGIDFNGTYFVAVGSGAGQRTMKSTDGVTWVAHASADEAANWKDVKWAGTKWAAVASSGATRTMNSPDGETWTGHAAATAEAWTSLAYGSAITTLVAQAGFGSTTSIMYSTDAGATWASGATLNTWKAATVSSVPTVAWLASAAVFCSIVELTSNSTYISLTSTDGASWTAHALPNNTEAPNFIVGMTSLELFAVLKGCYPNVGNPMSVLTSPDGATWAETEVADITDIFVWRAGGWSETLGQLVALDNAQNYKTLLGYGASLLGVTPSRGTKRGGTVLTLTGTGFAAVVQGDVLIDGTAATSVSVASDGLSLTCITPEHAVGPVDVTITGIGTLTAAYTYVSVDKVIPRGGDVAGGTAVTIRGYGFDLASGVTFDGTAASTWAITNNTTITATTPAHTSGLVDVAVGNVDTGADLYTYSIPLPKLPPLPVQVPPVPQLKDTLALEWIGWLQAIKTRVETQAAIAAEQVTSAGALTAVNDTNVTATLTGTPATALLKAVTVTMGWDGYLPVSRGGIGAQTVSIGDLLYGQAAGRLAVLGIGAANKFLKSDGSLPAWTAGAALTKTDDTNVTLTLGGSATTALVNAASLTLGWTGQLASSRGGTGFGTYAKGDLIYASAINTLSKLAATSDGYVLTLSSGVPVWAATTGLGTFGDTPSGAINGVNTTFTTTGAYRAGTLRVYLRGVRLQKSDYTETSPGTGVFTMGTAPTTGDYLWVDFGGEGTAIDAGNITSGTLAAARLPSSGVTAATYGSATQVPQIAVDVYGRITSASNVAISAGALVQLAQIVTTGSQATVDFTSIAATYNAIEVQWVSRDTQAGTGVVGFDCKVNNDGTAGNYTSVFRIGSQNAAAVVSNIAAGATGVQVGAHPQDGNTAGMAGTGSLLIVGYANTSFHKRLLARFGSDDATSNGLTSMHNARWKSTTAINRLTFTSGGTAFKDGSVFTLYGVL